MAYTLLTFIILAILLVNIAMEDQLQDCPMLVDPASIIGSGVHSTPANISDDNYCIVDQCTIKLTATGELLNVTALADNYLLANNSTIQQPMAITRLPTEVVCLIQFFIYHGYFIIKVLAFLFRFLLLILIAVASGYVLGIHLMFKVLRHLLGKLLIVYHSAVLAALFASLLLIMSNLLFAPGSQTVCQVFVHGYSLTYMLYEGIGTVVSAQVCYLMYRDYKNMADISPTWSDQLFEHYIIFSFSPMIPMAILTIGFDFTARIGNETILPTGHCILPPTNLYESLFLAYMYIAIHKICQLLVFIYTLHYFHKLYVSFGHKGQSTTDGKPDHIVTYVQPVDHPRNSHLVRTVVVMMIAALTATPPLMVTARIILNTGRLWIRCPRMKCDREEKYLRRLMISASFPGVTLLSIVLWFLSFTTGQPFSAGGGDVALLAQQATIAVVFLSSKKIAALCKERWEAFTNR